VISVAGNIQPDEVVSQIEAMFHSWSIGELSRGYVTNSKQDTSRLHIEHKNSEQVHLCLGTHGFSHSHPRRFALDLLNTAFGVGMSSRLFTEVRENKGLAYDIHSYAEHFHDSGSFVIYAGVDSSKVEDAVATIVEEAAKLRQGITSDELCRAKELSKGRLQLRLEDSQNVALWLGSQELLRQQILDIDEVISIVDALTTDELKEVAQEILTDNGLNLAIVGPVKKEKSLLSLLKL
jgi:predicted Zn-dependent peptidase